MAALKLLAKLVVYYAVVAGLIWLALWLAPGLRENLPIGRVQTLIAESGGAALPAKPSLADAVHAGGLAPSLVWLIAALLGALLASLPVSWTYMEVRNPKDYDQSLVDTIVVLPLVVTGIVVVVQHSLALSFSLAGIAGAARFRNSMKSSGDLLFIMLAIGMGLATGIGALELAIVTSAMFNLVFVGLWATEYGERANMKRFLGDFDPTHTGGHSHIVATTTATQTVTEVTEVTETVEKRDDDDDD